MALSFVQCPQDHRTGFVGTFHLCKPIGVAQYGLSNRLRVVIWLDLSISMNLLLLLLLFCFVLLVLLLFLFFLKFFWRTSVLFVGRLIPLFWTSGDVCFGFHSQGGSLCLHALFMWTVCRERNIYLKFKTEMSHMNTMCAECVSFPYGPFKCEVLL